MEPNDMKNAANKCLKRQHVPKCYPRNSSAAQPIPSQSMKKFKIQRILKNNWCSKMEALQLSMVLILSFLSLLFDCNVLEVQIKSHRSQVCACTCTRARVCARLCVLSHVHVSDFWTNVFLRLVYYSFTGADASKFNYLRNKRSRTVIIDGCPPTLRPRPPSVEKCIRYASPQFSVFLGDDRQF